MAFLNYTTSVPVATTVGQVTQMLAEHGARRISIEYDARKVPNGLGFVVDTANGPRAFALPIDATATHAALKGQSDAGKIRKGYATRAHAERVAWRIVREWLAVQLALIEAQMATLDVIMLPYLVLDGQGTTLAARYASAGMPALEA